MWERRVIEVLGSLNEKETGLPKGIIKGKLEKKSLKEKESDM